MKRSYKQNCALALTSDLLCERWTLLIFRELLIRPCRFKELNQILDGMGTNLLTNRLKELDAAGLIEKQSLVEKRSGYQLTLLGWSVEPIVLSLIRWGNGHLSGDEGFKHQHHWDLLAMKALYQSANYVAEDKMGLGEKPLKVQFKSDQLIAWCIASKNGLEIGLGELESSDLLLPFTLKDFQSIIKNKTQIEVNNPGALQQLLTCF